MEEQILAVYSILISCLNILKSKVKKVIFNYRSLASMRNPRRFPLKYLRNPRKNHRCLFHKFRSCFQNELLTVTTTPHNLTGCNAACPCDVR